MLVKFHILPQDFIKMSRREQAVLYAFCDNHIKEKEKEARRIKREAKKNKQVN